MDFNVLTKFHWLKLSNEQRFLIRKEFNIPKSGGVEMMGNQMISDGSNEKDLSVITVGSMQTFLGQESSGTDSFSELFNHMIEKIDSMIENENKKKFEEVQKILKQNRLQELDEVIDNVIATINNLPLDVQVLIINSYKHLITPKQEQKHAGTKNQESEEIEEADNEYRTKKTRGGSKATESIG